MELPVSSTTPANGARRGAVAPDGYRPSDYPPFAFTADVVLATIRNGHLCVLLIERAADPYAGFWALPGGFVNDRRPGDEADTAETAEEAAVRELGEETRIRIGGPAGAPGGVGHLEQLRTYSEPDRDPRMRVVSVAFVGMVPDLPNPVAASDATKARFWPVADLDLDSTGEGLPLAFDHARIISDGLERIRAKLEYTTLATAFCEEPFSIADLRRVYEAVWGVQLAAGNFHRKVTSAEGFIAAVDATTTGPGRPAQLYRRGPANELQPPLLRPHR